MHHCIANEHKGMIVMMLNITHKLILYGTDLKLLQVEFYHSIIVMKEEGKQIHHYNKFYHSIRKIKQIYYCCSKFYH